MVYGFAFANYWDRKKLLITLWICISVIIKFVRNKLTHKLEVNTDILGRMIVAHHKITLPS